MDIHILMKQHVHIDVDLFQVLTVMTAHKCNGTSNPWPTAACLISRLTAKRQSSPDSKVHGANMGPILGQQDPGGPHVGPMNFAIWVYITGYGGNPTKMFLGHSIIIFSLLSLANWKQKFIMLTLLISDQAMDNWLHFIDLCKVYFLQSLTVVPVWLNHGWG